MGTDNGANNGFIHIWNPNTRASVSSSFSGHTLKVNSIKALANNWIASGSDDHLITIWDFTTGALLTTMNEGVLVFAVEYLPNGYLASAKAYWAGSSTVNIWNPSTGASVYGINAHSSNVNTLQLLNNGDLISGSDDGYIKAWDTSSATYPLKYSFFLGYPVKCLKKFGAGLLAIGLSVSNQTVIWDTVNKNIIANLTGHSGSINALEIDLAGNLVSGSSDNLIKIWQAVSYSLLYTLIGHTAPINTLKLLSNGNLLSGSSDRYIKISNPSNGAWIQNIIVDSGVFSIITLTPDPTPTITLASSTSNSEQPISSESMQSITPMTTATQTSTLSAEVSTESSTLQSSTASIFDSTTLTTTSTSTLTESTTISKTTSSSTFTTTTTSTITTFISTTTSSSTTPSTTITSSTSTTQTISSTSASSLTTTSISTPTSTLTTQSSTLSSTLASSTTTTTLNTIVNVIVYNATFSFGQLTQNQTISLLENFDISSCFANCSNKGLCKFNLNNNVCECSCFH